ncbi:MAG: hypothetical protein JSR77_10675, partial [Planctomycetes bacterium]|nr:hypothetical protein [Planctomycetota bacterium]
MSIRKLRAWVSKGVRGLTAWDLAQSAGTVFEPLEGRQLLAVVTFVGPGAGPNPNSNWSNATNWSTGEVPGPNDDVIIGSTKIVAITSATQSVRSVNCAGSISMSGGALNVALSTVVDGALTISNARFGGGGLATVNDLLVSGSAVIEPGGAMTVNGGASFVAVDDISLQRDMLLNGASSWTRGRINQYNCTVTNNGTFTANSAGYVYWYARSGPAVFQNNGTFVNGGNTNRFENNGALMLFNNAGVVTVSSGSLQLYGGGAHSGAWSVEAGASTYLQGTHSFQSASTINSSGWFSVNGGSTNFAGASLSFATLAVEGGSVTGPTSLSTGTLYLSSGTLATSGAITTGILTMVGNGGLGAGGDLTVSGTATFSAGDEVYLQRNVVLNGTSNWSRGRVYQYNCTVTNNGTFTANSAGYIYWRGVTGTTTFQNNGTFINAGNTNRFENSGATMRFVNDGVVNV